jgi:sugar phosphate isomerase/epimerase
MVIRLSAFADEISPRLDQQIAVLRREGLSHLDLRSVDDVNVLDLDDAQVRDISSALRESGIAVAAIGSPIGKTTIDRLPDDEMRRLDRAIALAHAFECRVIRIFSFYAPADHSRGKGRSWPEAWGDEVVERLGAMTRRASAEDILLVHENEKDIYGDTIDRCVDLLSRVDDPHLRAAFDPANFIQCGQVPYPDAYEALKPWIAYVHVKDALPDGRVVPAGEGAGRWADFLSQLREDGYSGTLSLEPHLQEAGQFRGYSGPELFHAACLALQDMLRAMGWAWN